MSRDRDSVPLPDAIDRFADEIVRHPERADRLKAALRNEMRGKPMTPAGPASDPGDPEDYWNNVPV